MKKLLAWLEPRTIFAFMFYFTFLYLILRGLEVPDPLNTIVSLLMGFYFGNKNKGGGNGKDISNSGTA